MSQALETAPIAALKPYKRNARTHSREQVRQIAKSIERFGFVNPVLVDDEMRILAGHGRVEAAKLLKREEVPIVRISHMSEDEKRAYILADNRLAEKAGWDKDLLGLELKDLIELEFDMGAIGFDPTELDALLTAAGESDPDGPVAAEDAAPEPETRAVTRMGEAWTLGRHRLACADARDGLAYHLVLGDERADMLFTDPPYNVPIATHARVAEGHREFVMASGEMTAEEFAAFLEEALRPAAAVCRDGAIAYVCMDWRGQKALLQAGGNVFTEQKNLCVWSKSNGGMGSLYRSQHELIFVYKIGHGPHVNNIELGKHGRNRTNVWAYAGVNAFGAGRREELDLHPTVKPVALIEDAIRDVTHRGHIVLDPFGGSGSTLLAAQKTGRKARLIEIDPLYCDVILRRYARYTGKQPVLSTGETFEAIAEERLAEGL